MDAVGGEIPMVCSTCGSKLAYGRLQTWLHVEAIPEGVDPDHPAAPVAQVEFRAAFEKRLDVRDAVEQMLIHHDTFHAADCEWALRVRGALNLKR